MELIKCISDHVKQNKSVYLQAGAVAIGNLVFSPDIAMAGIDAGGQKIYLKILTVGKWAIIIKGGIEIIQNITNGDFENARRQFFQYLMIYGLLFALPWGMEEIENIFKGEGWFAIQ